MRGRILVIDRAVPTPDQDSGSASTVSTLTILAKAGFQVSFAPFDMIDGGKYTRSLQDSGIAVLTAPQFASIEEVIQNFAPQQDVILLYRVSVASATYDLCRQSAPQAKICFHAVDLHFLREQRHAELTGNAVDAEMAENTKSMELRLVHSADATIVVSAFEKQLLTDLSGRASINHIPILRAPPSFDRMRRLFLAHWGRSRRRDLLFLGGYRHLPNVDAVLWFVKEVWPLLLEAGFRHRFVIAGSHIPPNVAGLATNQIEIRGHVPHLADLFRQARISIAPLRFGGGVKGKVVTSLSYGIPVVGTSIAVEGMGLCHEESVLVADDPASFAQEILRIYGDDELWLRLSAGGLRAFDDRFSIASGTPKVCALFDRLVAEAKSNKRQRTVLSASL